MNWFNCSQWHNATKHHEDENEGISKGGARRRAMLVVLFCVIGGAVISSLSSGANYDKKENPHHDRKSIACRNCYKVEQLLSSLLPCHYCWPSKVCFSLFQSLQQQKNSFLLDYSLLLFMNCHYSVFTLFPKLTAVIVSFFLASLLLLLIDCHCWALGLSFLYCHCHWLHPLLNIFKPFCLPFVIDSLCLFYHWQPCPFGIWQPLPFDSDCLWPSLLTDSLCLLPLSLWGKKCLNGNHGLYVIISYPICPSIVFSQQSSYGILLEILLQVMQICKS